MAKKKSKSAEKNIAKEKKSMVSKVEVKNPEDQEKVSRIVGSIFIFLGIVLISYGIFSFIKFSNNPQLDESLDSPSLAGTDVLVNTDDIVLRGSADGFDQILVYVDNEEVGKAEVGKDSSFEYVYTSSGEGLYAVSVAGIKGFPKRYVSPQSDMKIIEVDKTDPVLGEIKYSPEVGTETFTVLGNVEAGAEVILRRGTDKYVVECDDNGDFKISGILLEEGPNVYSMEIIDTAGNSVDVEERIKVIYSMDSDINGDAVEDSLPVAAGELDAALRIVRENNLMVILGLVALLSFMISSGFAIVKYKGRE